MDLGLHKKVALVLASSKGLGKAVATELAKEGAKVVICGTDALALQATEKEIDAIAPGKVASFICDITEEASRKQLIEQSVNAFGPIDILVTNTGGPAAGVFEEFTLSDWRHLYNLLFLSAVDII
ncbi:MAG: family oxidoreductase, partial [Flaviaesturariibacter sp.]|nr:family oxidoreductase [Flaviaesturariibacter sp.]